MPVRQLFGIALVLIACIGLILTIWDAPEKAFKIAQTILVAIGGAFILAMALEI